MSMPMRAEAAGTRRMQTTHTSTAKTRRSSFETGRSDFMRMSRSFLVVSSRMIGGWMIGTIAM